jgi:hypothetical protein
MLRRREEVELVPVPPGASRERRRRGDCDRAFRGQRRREPSFRHARRAQSGRPARGLRRRTRQPCAVPSQSDAWIRTAGPFITSSRRRLSRRAVRRVGGLGQANFDCAAPSHFAAVAAWCVATRCQPHLREAPLGPTCRGNESDGRHRGLSPRHLAPEPWMGPEPVARSHPSGISLRAHRPLRGRQKLSSPILGSCAGSLREPGSGFTGGAPGTRRRLA